MQLQLKIKETELKVKCEKLDEGFRADEC